MRAAVVLAVCLSATPALAGGAAKAPPKPDSNSVDMPILVAPMVVDGRLTGYAYLNPVIEAASSSAVFAVRDKTPFLQDAFIRDVNGTPIVDSADPAKADVPKLSARLLADARRILGAAAVKGLSFSQIQISPLVPGQPEPGPTPASQPAQ